MRRREQADHAADREAGERVGLAFAHLRRVAEAQRPAAPDRRSAARAMSCSASRATITALADDGFAAGLRHRDAHDLAACRRRSRPAARGCWSRRSVPSPTTKPVPRNWNGGLRVGSFVPTATIAGRMRSIAVGKRRRRRRRRRARRRTQRRCTRTSAARRGATLIGRLAVRRRSGAAVACSDDHRRRVDDHRVELVRRLAVHAGHARDVLRASRRTAARRDSAPPRASPALYAAVTSVTSPSKNDSSQRRYARPPRMLSRGSLILLDVEALGGLGDQLHQPLRVLVRLRADLEARLGLDDRQREARVDAEGRRELALTMSTMRARSGVAVHATAADGCPPRSPSAEACRRAAPPPPC